MSWFFNLIDSVSGNIAKVDDDGEQLVALNKDPAKAGAVRLYDANGIPILNTENGALTVSLDNPVLTERVDGSNVNTNKWTQNTSGMTITQGGGFITLNAGGAVTANAYAILTSIKYIPTFGHLPVKATFNVQIPTSPQINQTIEFGVGFVATNAAPTDGVFIRWNSSGQVLFIINNGGNETASATISAQVLPLADVEIFDIIIVEDQAQLFIGDVLIATVAVPAGQAFPMSAGSVPVFARVVNGGTPPQSAPKMLIGQVIVVQQAIQQNRKWEDVLVSMGQGSYQLPINPFSQTPNHTNSTGPVSATLSNTAAGYTTLGGRFQFAAVSGAVTDYALFAFQVPVGYQLYVTDIAVSSVITGAAVVTATILDWSVGLNSSAVSLATVDGVGTWAARRVPIGLQGFQALAGIGTMANDLSRHFNVPMLVDGGRYFHAILAIPNGAATGSLVFRGDFMVHGYME